MRAYADFLALWGHRVDSQGWRAASGERVCGCGHAFLKEDASESRIGHVLRCFLGSHRYRRIATRQGHNEYACQRCGHPLLMEESADPYPANRAFRKKVNTVADSSAIACIKWASGTDSPNTLATAATLF